jgi:hypothetical protein
VGLLIVLLFGHLLLNLPQVKQFGRLLVQRGQLGLQDLSVLFKLGGVLLLQQQNFILVVTLGQLQFVVPVLVKVLVLLNVGLLALLSLLLVHENQLFLGPVELLLLQLGNAIFGHLSLDITALFLASRAMFLHCNTTKIRYISSLLMLLYNSINALRGKYCNVVQSQSA